MFIMWANIYVLTLLLSVCLDDVGGFKHLKKLFGKKDTVKECDIVWTEHVHPHCETTEEKVCETVYEDVCTVEYISQCRQIHEPVCHTDYTTECKTSYSQKCETEHSQQCKTEYSQACSSYPKCWEVEEEKCSVKYQKICTADLAMPEPVKPKEQPEKRWKRSVHKLKRTLVKKAQKKSELVHALLQKRSVPTLQKLPEPVFPEEQDEEKIRTKRFAHHLLKKLVSKKSEDNEKEELCHHVPHKHCVVVPVEKCEDVEECHDVPEEKCWQEPQERCWEEPQEECWQEPRETCNQEARQVCEEKPQETCNQVPREQCSQVPREHCEYLPKLVAKKQCKDKKDEAAWTIPDLRGSIKKLLGRS